ncbi:MAG TPA: YihY/virulence factor BrkB family protein, partial [Sedimentisphaerales bacterium]|nr:YihY/virulence factor BrkB family protein [Sedimentisphaerales bacterium]
MMLENLRRLLATPTEELGRFSRFWVFQAKLWWHCGRLLIVNRASQQAAALSYHTIFGIVPLVIVMLLIFQAIPASGDISARLMGMVFDQLHLSAIEIPGEDGASIRLTQHLEAIFKTFFTEQHRGAITIISVLFIIWAAIGLLSIIERTFNAICNVSKGRNLLQQIRDYWAILTLGPILLATAIYVSTQFAAVEHVKHMVAPAVLNYIFSVAGFFLLYLIMPNARLSLKAVLWGSVVAALAWTMVKGAFGYYVSNFRPYATVYG